MFSSGNAGAYVAEKAESSSGWFIPVGDEVHELGYNHMFTDMFDSIEKGKQPQETFMTAMWSTRSSTRLTARPVQTVGTGAAGRLAWQRRGPDQT